MRHTARRGLAVALFALAGLAAVSTGTGPLPGDDPFEATLARMSDKQIQAYVWRHPDAVDKVAGASQTEMAELWASLTPPQRVRLTYLAPDKIGNLGGLDYATRERANRRSLRVALADAESSGARTLASTLRLASLRAIKKALLAPSHPRRHLVAFTDGSPALAAISIGDLDTARQITFAVPGMGTYTTDMQLWAQAGQNIYEEQGEAGAPRARAVVAWINYAAPPQGLDAAKGQYAQQGAPRLAAAVAGVTAARPGTKKPSVSIVAHSYGTTLAANALAADDLGVRAFVMLGSAGIEPAIGSASALNADEVWAAEAARDPLARFGRASRIDPRSPEFGAQVFRVDGVEDDPDLVGVTGHEPILHSAWNDNAHSTAWKRVSRHDLRRQFGNHLRQHGYLDKDTESLYNIAVLTTPGARRGLR